MRMRMNACISVPVTLAACLLAACTQASDGPGDDGDGKGSGSSAGHGCSTGSLLAGDPLYDGDIGGANVAGQGLLADPPIRNEAIAVIGSRLFVETEFEI